MRNLPRAAIVAAIIGVSLVRPAAEQQQPAFRASTHYVAVDVVVTDRDDRPVTDLTREDFEIVEGGRRQAIVDFAFVRVPLAHRAIDVDAAAVTARRRGVEWRVGAREPRDRHPRR